MVTFLLDSGIIIDVLNSKRGRRELIEKLIVDGAVMACCPINVTEVYSGLRPGEEAKTERLLRSLKFTPSLGKSPSAGELQNAWRQEGRTLSLPDVSIAAIAIAHDLMLLTGNEKDFPMPELQLYR